MNKLEAYITIASELAALEQDDAARSVLSLAADKIAACNKKKGEDDEEMDDEDEMDDEEVDAKKCKGASPLILLDPDLGPRLHKCHASSDDVVYELGVSAFSGVPVSSDKIEASIKDLEDLKSRAKGSNRSYLANLITDLELSL